MYRRRMSVKVKRGLGLLVVALMALLVLWTTGSAGAPANDFGRLLYVGLTFASAIVLLGALVVGLALLAWGLLRE